MGAEPAGALAAQPHADAEHQRHHSDAHSSPSGRSSGIEQHPDQRAGRARRPRRQARAETQREKMHRVAQQRGRQPTVHGPAPRNDPSPRPGAAPARPSRRNSSPGAARNAPMRAGGSVQPAAAAAMPPRARPGHGEAQLVIVAPPSAMPGRGPARGHGARDPPANSRDRAPLRRSPACNRWPRSWSRPSDTSMAGAGEPAQGAPLRQPRARPQEGAGVLVLAARQAARPAAPPPSGPVTQMLIARPCAEAPQRRPRRHEARQGKGHGQRSAHRVAADDIEAGGSSQLRDAVRKAVEPGLVGPRAGPATAAPRPAPRPSPRGRTGSRPGCASRRHAPRARRGNAPPRDRCPASGPARAGGGAAPRQSSPGPSSTSARRQGSGRAAGR
jgi:hypothetical protein